jgi:hypothetical protein
MAFVGYRNNMGHVRNANAYPSFRAPLTSSLDLLNGTASATFARSTTATVVDHNGQVNTAEIDEARFEGARRIQENRYSEQTGENAIEFDGNDGINIGVPITLNGTNDFSICGWINLNTDNIKSAMYGAEGFNFIIGVDQNNYPFFAFWTSLDAQRTVTGTTKLKIGDWNHICATYNSSTDTASLFVNSSSVGTPSVSGGMRTYTTQYIGTAGGATPRYLNGITDNIKVFNKVLDSDERIAEYNSTNKNENITAQDNLVGWWKLDDTTSTIIDYSGNGNDGVFNSGGSPATPTNVEGVYDSGTLIPQETLKGYLSEEQRTNLITWSEQLNNATGGWSEDNSTVSLNQNISPDGLQTADRIIGDNITDNLGISKTISGLTDNTDYTFSVFVKEQDFPFARLNTVDKAGSSVNSWFDLNNGILGTVNHDNAKIESIGNSWYRISVILDISSGATTPIFRIRLADVDNLNNTIGNGSDYNIFFGAMLEAGSFASSYIPTTTTTITRTADSLSYGAEDIKQGEGSIVCEFNQLGIDSGVFSRLLQMDNETANTRIAFIVQPIEKAGWSIVNNSITQADIVLSNNSYNYNEFNKIGISYKDNSVDGFLNGTLEGSDTSATIPTDISQIRIAKGLISEQINGNLKNVQIFKKKLTNSELIRRTK